VRVPLPIDEVLEEIRSKLRNASSLVLSAPPGSGKSTRVPPALLELVQGRILMLQPRRVAARMVAERIAQENGWRLGEEAGYHIRFDRRTGPRTRIQVVTEGLLQRYLLSDPFLEGTGLVILDEFHERSIYTDLALAQLRELQQAARPDLKILVMSATLDAERLVSYLESPRVEASGRTHPVELSYMPPAGTWLRTDDLPERVLAALRKLLSEASDDGGHVLVFLPGAREIDACVAAAGRAFPGVDCLPLHARLPESELTRALRSSEKRKLLFSTNVAETSLTIDGVSSVVDSGLVRVARTRPPLLLDGLFLEKISQASSDQRAGRAGRQRPGRCVRLWPRDEQSFLEPYQEPEIHRIDLSPQLLALLDMGFQGSWESFPWFEAPRGERLNAALRQLRLLGIIDGEGRLSTLGRRCARWPLAPRFAAYVERASATWGWRRAWTDAAARLSETLPSPRLFEALARTAEELAGRSLQEGGVPEELWRQSLIFAYPDRLCRLRAGQTKALMVGGRGVQLPREPQVLGELFVALEITDAGGGDARLSKGEPVTRAWLEELRPDLLAPRTEAEFDEKTGKLSARRALCWDDLPLQEPTPVPLAEGEAASLLADWCLRRWERVLADKPELANWLRRWELARSLLTEEAPWPSWEGERLRQAIEAVAQGCRSYADLKNKDWLPVFEGLSDARQLRALRAELPESLTMPSGRNRLLEYREDGRVFLSARIQDFFGWKQGPQLARGRLSLHMEMLSPAQRPMQTTTDLARFWKGSYQEIRKELRARYPKHKWPEDP
jgi:ATP-dependent helicase HrpB